jgi:Pyruvate/2-oxoacid:ferredoxin oxidoreductase delta subunit
VQLYTKLHNSGINSQKTLTDFNTGLLEYMQTHYIGSIDTVRGQALYLLELPTALIAKVPNIDKDKCIGCKLCRQVCFNNAVYLENNKSTIKEDECKGCGHCVSVCPTHAMDI